MRRHHCLEHGTRSQARFRALRNNGTSDKSAYLSEACPAGMMTHRDNSRKSSKNYQTMPLGHSNEGMKTGNPFEIEPGRPPGGWIAKHLNTMGTEPSGPTRTKRQGEKKYSMSSQPIDNKGKLEEQTQTKLSSETWISGKYMKISYLID
jgi:hypothetical protein